MEVDAGTEKPVRRFVQHVLRGGLALALALMLTGLVVKLASGDATAPAVPLFSLTHAPSAGDALMAIGVLVLALTPAVRVLSLLALWTRERDYRFVRVAVVVLIVLCASIALGHG